MQLLSDKSKMVMLTTSPRLRTSAADRAAMNFAGNRDVLRRMQPRVAQTLADDVPALEFLFGRDGALTALDERGGWVEGCSLPLHAAREMLKTIQIGGRTGCFLDPTHAAQLRAALDGLSPMQAIVALLPDPSRLPLMLACEDFSAEMSAHRLWFCSGPDLSQAICDVFADNPGLATPSHFIRTGLLDDESAQPLIRTAEQAFSRINTQRQDQLRTLARRPIDNSAPWCVVAPLAFRVWEDAGWTLAKTCDAFESKETIVFNPDDPASASPLSLARASVNASGIVASNLVRSDMPGVFPIDRPWIAWITGPRIGTFTTGTTRDAILLADERWRPSAIAAGWPADRIHLAAWPALHPQPSDQVSADSHLVLLADAIDLKPPPAVCELSSQRLLWEQIARELTQDPFRLGHDPLRYLHQRLRTFNIAKESLNAPFFINELLIPAYQQGIVRLLLRSQFPLRLYGRGWEAYPEFAPCRAGEITDRARFQQVVLDPRSVLIHPMPVDLAHPIDALPGRRLWVQDSAAGLLRQVTAQLQGKTPTPPVERRPLSRALVSRLLA